jgi:hypothetical protein
VAARVGLWVYRGEREGWKYCLPYIAFRFGSDVYGRLARDDEALS